MIEKYAVDSDDNVEHRAAEMVKTGEALTIMDARDLAFKEEQDKYEQLRKQKK